MKCKWSHPRECMIFFAGGEKTGEYRYTIEYNYKGHEIICPLYTFPDKAPIVVVPYFLIPGRKYPIQVYLYAINLYSTDPKASQRNVAEKTREKFGLGKFSHSTLCRTFKVLEESIKKALGDRFGDEHKTGTEMLNDGDTGKLDAPSGNRKTSCEEEVGKRRFPTVEDTYNRRKRMCAYLSSFTARLKNLGVGIASKVIVEHWHMKTKRLLI
jgi:hypothetical protein